MEILVLGLNHKSAPLHIREKVAFPENEIAAPLRSITGHAMGCLIRVYVFLSLPDPEVVCSVMVIGTMPGWWLTMIPSNVKTRL